MKKGMILFLICLLPVAAWGQGYPWKDHAPPFDFLFGNEIDTHQQSNILGSGDLQGSLYIVFEENGQADLHPGIPTAMHGDCELNPEECTAGWILYGVPVEAVFIGMGGGFPLWCIDAADLPVAPGYSHFHWTGDPETAAGLTVGQVYSGFLMKLTAVDTFLFHMEGHQNPILVTPGIDDNSHANIVTDCLQ